MLFALLLAVTAPPSDVCAKLAKDFEGNERFYTMMRGLDAEILEIEIESQKMVAPYEQQAAIAEAQARALGVYVPRRFPQINNLEKIEKTREKIKETDKEFQAKGDRITTLMIANKCEPPDHVTSWTTYPP